MMSKNSSKSERPKDVSYSADPLVAFCLVFVLAGFGAFGYWSATAQLAQGVAASGVLIVEDRRRTIQHLEGGIIQDIHIRDGQEVTAGNLAMIISDANSTARFSQVNAEQLRLLAELDRYSAQMTSTEVLTFPRLTAVQPDASETADLIALNKVIFEDQRAAQNGERALVEARIDRLRAEANAIEVRRAGKKREIITLQDEQDVQNAALSRQLGNISRVNEVARLLAITETELANVDEDERVIERTIGEARLELNQIDLANRSIHSAAFAEASRQLAGVSDELKALTDRQKRSNVIVPVDGVVIDLAYTAKGGVVAPGAPLFEIVPSGTLFEVEVRFQPKDRDDLAVGRDVNLRFGTLDPINPPEIIGTLETIAADASYDQQSNVFYYLSRIKINSLELEVLSDFAISPGIPVEIFFDKGTPRTPLSYFIEPVVEMFRLGMRS